LLEKAIFSGIATALWWCDLSQAPEMPTCQVALSACQCSRVLWSGGVSLAATVRHPYPLDFTRPVLFLQQYQ